MAGMFGGFTDFLYLCSIERQDSPDLDYVSLNYLIP